MDQAGRNLARLCAVIAVTVGALFAGTSIAAAANERIDIEVDGAWILQDTADSGTFFGYQANLSRRNSVKMSADLNPDGTFTVPASQYKFEVTQIVGGGSSGSITFSAARDFTGSYDRTTGAMAMTIPMKYTLLMTNPSWQPGDPGPQSAGCAVTGFTIPFETRGTVISGSLKLEGAPFVDGFGQLLGGWTIAAADLTVTPTDPSSAEFCETMSSSSYNFTGKLWMDAVAKVVDTTPPVPPITTALAFKTTKASLKAGKSTGLMFQIQNGTDADRIIKVTFKSSNRAVTVKKTFYAEVPANTALLTPINVKATKKAKGKAKITATAEGLASSSTVTVKKLKKPKKK